MAANSDFTETAREWLVRATGHARPEHVASLAKELETVYDAAIEEHDRVHNACVEQAWDAAGAVLGGLMGMAEAIRGTRNGSPSRR